MFKPWTTAALPLEDEYQSILSYNSAMVRRPQEPETWLVAESLELLPPYF
jgi:hypothetical protein